MSELLDRLQKLRQDAGMSRADFCRMFDIPVRTVEQWDSGKCEPAIYTLKMLITLMENCQKSDIDMVKTHMAGMEFAKIFEEAENRPFYKGADAYTLNEILGRHDINAFMYKLMSYYVAYEKPFPQILTKIQMAPVGDNVKARYLLGFLGGALIDLKKVQ